MNAKANSGAATGATTNAAARPPIAGDLATMDRDALLALIDSLFRWALRHTGLTRQQILAQIEREGGAPP